MGNRAITTSTASVLCALAVSATASCVLDVDLDRKRCDDEHVCVYGFCVEGVCVDKAAPGPAPLPGEGEGEIVGEGEGEGDVVECGPIELCNDNLDNDCDGTIDEGCLGCFDDDSFDGAFASVCTGPLDHAAARDACAERGLALAVLDNAKFSDHVRGLASAFDVNLWIGLTDVDVEGTFVWDDGKELLFEDFSPLQPNDTDGGQDCGEILADDHLWNDNTCTDLEGFICALPPAPVVAACSDTGQREICGDRIDNDCDGVVDERCSSCSEHGDIDGGDGILICQRLVTWDQANERCTDKRMTLAKLDRAGLAGAVDAPMRGVGNGRQRAWIGLNDQAAEATYRWSDGDLLEFTRFEQTQPDNVQAQDCVDVRDDNGDGQFGWGDLDCRTRSSYICTK